MGNITTGLLEIFARKFAEKVDSLFVRKAAGKGLSSNDYTTAEKTKLSGVSDGAQVNKIESISVNGAVVLISGKNVNLEVLTAADLAAYYTSEQVDQKLSAATQSKAGLMSAADKTKLDGMTEATEAEIDAIIAGTFE